MDATNSEAPHTSATPHRRRPQLGVVAGSSNERHASALELFFDLVFVVAVAELAETLLHHPTATGALQYIALFVPVWWAWVGYTFFADRLRDDNDITHRVIMILAMLAVTFLAVSIPDAFTPNGSIRFAVSYVAVRALLILLYARAHYYDPAARPLTSRYLAGFVAGASIWLASAFVPTPARYALWALGLLIELATPLASAKAIARVPFHTSHIPERFALFVIIVLGEAVTLDAIGIADSSLDTTTLAIAGAGFLNAAALWWLYFDCVDATPMQRWRRSGQTYVYAHLIVFAAITAFGVGVLLATEAAHDPHLEMPARWALCAGIGAFLLAIGAIQLSNTSLTGDVRTWTRLGIGAVVTLAPTVSKQVPLPALEVTLLAALAIQITVETQVARRTAFVPHRPL